MAVFSLILSLIGLVVVSISFASFGFGAPLGIVVSIVSLVISIIKREDDIVNKKVYNYAIVISIVGICIGVVLFALFINSVSGSLIAYLKSLMN